MDEDLRKVIDNAPAETRRHFDTVAERLESKIETVAEGVVSVNERLGRFEMKMHEEFYDVQAMICFSQTRAATPARASAPH